MIKVDVVDDKLVIAITGIDRFLAFKGHIEVPLAHVERASLGVDPEAEKFMEKSFRLPGAYAPGLAIEGSYYRHGEWLFYAIHSGENAITVRFHDEEYKAAVLEVDDPGGTVRRIEAALGRGGRASA